MPECKQDEYGPTPCFREAVQKRDLNVLPCGLEICPIVDHMKEDSNLTGWNAVHHFCIITDPQDYKGKLHSIQLALIAKNKNN